MSPRKVMISPAEAQEKAARTFNRRYKEWAGEMFLGDMVKEEYVINLCPPTEKEALQDLAAAKKWVQSWLNVNQNVQWCERQWSSIGKQKIPEKVLLTTKDEIADFAGKALLWECVKSRTHELANRWKDSWSKSCPQYDDQMLRQAIKTTVAKYCDLSDEDWQVYLSVLEWFVTNQGQSIYPRQLPIRGVHGKWFENHRGVCEPLYRAMVGQRAFELSQVPTQVRVRFLDGRLSPSGLRDVSVVPNEFNDYAPLPKKVIICENLVSVVTLPDMPDTIAIHGRGYAVNALTEIEWLSDAQVYYWGDIDSNGFAILNRLRSYLPDVISIMMDAETLEVHRSLCVVEGSPNYSDLQYLNEAERSVLNRLLSGKQALRLEQERIEWSYVLEKLRDIIP